MHVSGLKIGFYQATREHDASCKQVSVRPSVRHIRVLYRHVIFTASLSPSFYFFLLCSASVIKFQGNPLGAVLNTRGRKNFAMTMTLSDLERSF